MDIQATSPQFLYGRTARATDKVAFLSMPRMDAPLPTVFTAAEVQRVLDGFLVAKYRVFFMLIYATGLRIREANLLETRDINAFQQVIHVRNGKEGKDRLMPIPPKLYGLLRTDWKQEHPPEPRLFAA